MVEQSLEERLETLESQREEFDLLKTEIRQTLVELKEAISNDGAIFHAVAHEPQNATPESGSNGGPSPVSHEQPEEPPPLALSPCVSPLADENKQASVLSAPPSDYRNGPHPSGSLDAAMMGNIIWWLGTAKRSGLTLQLLTPILETYEMSGTITHSISKLILRSMAALDALYENMPGDEFSPQDYADGLLQLHDIICTPGYVVDRTIAHIPALGRDTATTMPVRQQPNRKAKTASK